MKKLFKGVLISTMLFFSISVTAYGYIKYNYGYPTSKIAIQNLISPTSVYDATFDNALKAWNNATSVVNLTEATSSLSTVEVGSYADAWVGTYTSKLSNSKVVGFTIRLNSRTLDSRSANYKQSTLVHELGHALSLADNPPESPSIMRHDRNRDVIIVPQADDIKGVTTIYGTSSPDDGGSVAPNKPGKGNRKDRPGKLALASDISFDYSVYDNERNMLSESEVIVNGSILNSTVQTINIAKDSEPLYIDYQVLEVKVTDVMKGDINVGDTIKVKLPMDDEKMVNINKYLNKNSDVIFFLEDYSDVDSEMPYSLINADQGIIKFNKNKIEKNSINSSNKDFEITNLNNKNDILNYLKSLK